MKERYFRPEAFDLFTCQNCGEQCTKEEIDRTFRNVILCDPCAADREEREQTRRIRNEIGDILPWLGTPHG